MKITHRQFRHIRDPACLGLDLLSTCEGEPSYFQPASRDQEFQNLFRPPRVGRLGRFKCVVQVQTHSYLLTGHLLALFAPLRLKIWNYENCVIFMKKQAVSITKI